MLFAPADRPDRVAKALDIADLVIIDLEDAVAPAARPAARGALAELAARIDIRRCVVRINPTSTPDCALDVAAMTAAGFDTCMLAKAESAEDVAAVGPLRVVALIETPLGILQASGIAAAPSCVGVMFGSEDLALGLGAAQSRPGGLFSGILETARHTVLLAARAHGVLAIDAVFVDLDDDAGLREEAVVASNMGFDAKACVHPRQVGVVREAFQPSTADAAWAERVVQESAGRGEAVFQLDGQMIDAPVIRRAEAILRRRPPR